MAEVKKEEKKNPLQKLKEAVDDKTRTHLCNFHLGDVVRHESNRLLTSSFHLCTSSHP